MQLFQTILQLRKQRIETFALLGKTPRRRLHSFAIFALAKRIQHVKRIPRLFIDVPDDQRKHTKFHQRACAYDGYNKSREWRDQICFTKSRAILRCRGQAAQFGILRVRMAHAYQNQNNGQQQIDRGREKSDLYSHRRFSCLSLNL